MAKDSDLFNRWDAGQQFATDIMLDMVKDIQAGKEAKAPDIFIQALKGAGMSLEAIADYINLAKLGEQTCQQRKKILAQARDVLLQKIEALQNMARLADYQLMSYDTVLRPRTDSLVGAFTSA